MHLVPTLAYERCRLDGCPPVEHAEVRCPQVAVEAGGPAAVLQQCGGLHQSEVSTEVT